MYSALQIAVVFAKKGIGECKYVTQMKLQKLVYFAHGYHLAIYNDPLIKEDVQAWEFGPVIPSIYHAFKLYGSDIILDLKYIDASDKDLSISLDKKSQDAVDYTWSALKDISASKLSAWTHKNDSPWQKAYQPNIKNIVIKNPEIETYFKGVVLQH